MPLTHAQAHRPCQRRRRRLASTRKVREDEGRRFPLIVSLCVGLRRLSAVPLCSPYDVCLPLNASPQIDTLIIHFGFLSCATPYQPCLLLNRSRKDPTLGHSAPETSPPFKSQMASKTNRPHENKGDQRELVESDWWRTFFNSISWTYPPSQGSASRRPSRRSTLLRLSRASQLLRAALSRHPLSLPSGITTPMTDELSRDLVGVRVVEDVLRSYESNSGFDMFERFLHLFRLGWVLDDEQCIMDGTPSEEYQDQWEEHLRSLFEESFKRLPEELYLQDFSPDHSEERLKELSPYWDSCLDSSSTLDDLIRSLESADLTDSELSADSDPLPITPRARHHSSSPVSAHSLRPLSATASSFVPTPAKYHSPSSASPSPSPSPPVLDIINFPTLRQTILSAPKKDDREGKSRTKRPSVPSFLADKADARKSKTRQIVDGMKSGYDPRKPEFIAVIDDSPPEDAFGPVEPVVKCNKKRSRRGRESISTVSTDDMGYSSSIDLSTHRQPPTTTSPMRSTTSRPPSKNSKRAPSLTMTVPHPARTPPTPAFSSPAGSVSSFGGPVTPGPFAVQFPPPPTQQPPHPAFIQMQQRSPPFPTPFSYPYGLPGTGMIPPTPFPNTFAGPYPPPQFGGYLNGKSMITGASGIRHASW